MSSDLSFRTAICARYERLLKSRIRELVSVWPGEFQVIDQQSHQIVAWVSDLLKQRSPLVESHRM